MKFIVHLTLLLVFVSASKERSNNQEALEGVWEYFKQQGPYTVSQCGSDQDHKDAFLFVGYILKKADITSTSEINPLLQEAEQFYNSLPVDTRNCFENNSEVVALGKLLGLDQYSGDELENKISNWVGTHFFIYKKLIKAAGNDWNGWEDYYQTGQDIAELLNRILTDTLQE